VRRTGGAAVGRISANATWMMPAESPTATPMRQAKSDGAYMNGALSTHQWPTKTIAAPPFFADRRCPLL